MFGKLTPEQKEAMRQRFANALASGDAPSQQPPVPSDGSASDGDDSDADNQPQQQQEQHHQKQQQEGPTSAELRKHEAEETLRVNTKSETVEITNIRLFSMEELDLARLSECRSLSLRKNLIHNLTPLPEHLAGRLTELDFFDNKIKKIGKFFEHVTDDSGNESEKAEKSGGDDRTAAAATTAVAAVKVVPNAFGALTKLDLSYNQIKKVAGLEVLATTLKELYLVENKIKVIQGVDALTNLELLELGGNRIREIGGGLATLKKLKQLWLGKNKIANIGNSLNELTSLELLSLQANRILKIESENFPESANPCLREVYLSENGISAIENLPIHHIKILDFSFNPISHIADDVINATNMPDLEEFWLTDGKIDSWAEVDKFKPFTNTLRTVYLERNPIEQDKRYRDKVYLSLPFVTQIDSWPVINKDNLEADRTIQRRNPRG